MFSMVGFVAERMGYNCGQEGTVVVIRWSETTGGSVHPLTGAVVGGTKVNQVLTVRGFTFWPTAEQIKRARWESVVVGDCVVDLPPGVWNDVKGDAWVEVDGVRYTPSRTGENLSAGLDVLQGGVRLMRTMLLKRMV